MMLQSLILTLLLTLCGLASTSSGSHKDASCSADWSMKKPILVHLNLSNLLLNVLIVVASTAPWSNWFHIFISLLGKSVFYCDMHLTLIN